LLGRTAVAAAVGSCGSCSSGCVPRERRARGDFCKKDRL
jgi:hypothetical protein